MLKHRLITTAVTAIFVAVTSLTTLAASAFEGVWKVKDTAGKPFAALGGVEANNPELFEDRPFLAPA